MGTAIKHPMPDRLKLSFVIFDRAERQGARMSKITNDGLIRSGIRCFIAAVPIWQQRASIYLHALHAQWPTLVNLINVMSKRNYNVNMQINH